MKKIMFSIISLLIIVLSITSFNIYCMKKVELNSSNPLNKENNILDDVENTGDDNLENIDINVSYPSNIGGGKLVQFDTEFYNLKDIAKEYRSFKDVKNHIDFNYDLDGDSVVDKITFSCHNYDCNVKLNGVNAIEWIEYEPIIYLVDLNINDNTMEVVIYTLGPSGYNVFSIYSKVGNKLEKIYEKVGDALNCDKFGLVVVEDSYKLNFNPTIYFDYVYIENGLAANKTIDVERIKNVDISNSTWYFSKDYKNKEKISNVIGLDPDRVSEINIEQLTDNLTFRISKVEFIDNEYVLHVKLSDERVGYVFPIQWAG